MASLKALLLYLWARSITRGPRDVLNTAQSQIPPLTLQAYSNVATCGGGTLSAGAAWEGATIAHPPQTFA